MTDPSPAELLEAARHRAGLTERDLWIAYCAIGGLASPATLHDYLAGSAIPDRHDYDQVAQALNEAFLDRGGDHPVPYADEIQFRFKL